MQSPRHRHVRRVTGSFPLIGWHNQTPFLRLGLCRIPFSNQRLRRYWFSAGCVDPDLVPGSFLTIDQPRHMAPAIHAPHHEQPHERPSYQMSQCSIRDQRHIYQNNIGWPHRGAYPEYQYQYQASKYDRGSKSVQKSVRIPADQDQSRSVHKTQLNQQHYPYLAQRWCHGPCPSLQNHERSKSSRYSPYVLEVLTRHRRAHAQHRTALAGYHRRSDQQLRQATCRDSVRLARGIPVCPSNFFPFRLPARGILELIIRLVLARHYNDQQLP